MRVLVCGGRDFGNAHWLYTVLNDLKRREVIDCIIEGDAPGADRMAGFWAKKNRIDLKLYPANWSKYGKAAGPIRNQHMLDAGKPDLVIAFPRADGEYGSGTQDMMRRASEAGVTVFRPTQQEGG